MRLAALIAFGIGSGQAAMACTPGEVTRDEVSRGQQCQVNYAWTDKPSVGSSGVEDLGSGVIKQVISTGACNQGEMIVVYYDCKTGQGAWLGGTKDTAPELQPRPSGSEEWAAPYIGEGISGGFIRTQEGRFAPEYDVKAIYALAERLEWVTDKGRLSQSRISVDGGAFDLKCGCDLYYSSH